MHSKQYWYGLFNFLVLLLLHSKQDLYVVMERIDIIANKSDESIKFLSKLQKAAMNDKKIALKDNIYTCLNAGFVTPKERDKIALDYESYCELGGNHDVKNLYEEHFLKLNVHHL